MDFKEKTGLYLGTEIDETWWKRCTDDGLLARGQGRYSHDQEYFYFYRVLITDPVRIPLKDVFAFRIGRWHSGRWCLGYSVLKIVWMKNGKKLSSGFLVSKNNEDVEVLISELKKKTNT